MKNYKLLDSEASFGKHSNLKVYFPPCPASVLSWNVFDLFFSQLLVQKFAFLVMGHIHTVHTTTVGTKHVRLIDIHLVQHTVALQL